MANDVNYSVGSWGPQREDDTQPIRVVPASQLLTREDWLQLAVRWSEFALRAIEQGRANEAAYFAQMTTHFCRQHQLSGGQPWDKLEIK